MFATIKERLARNEIVMSAAVGRIPHYNFIQMIGLTGNFHALWFDQEHCGLTTEQLEVGTLAARSVEPGPIWQERLLWIVLENTRLCRFFTTKGSPASA